VFELNFRRLKAGEKGAAALEFALVLPTLLILVFGVIDVGRLIHARLIVTNVSREGGSLASRGFKSADDLLNMLRASGAPLDLNGSGKICVSRIRCGASADEPDPYIQTQFSTGALNVATRVRDNFQTLGLSDALYQHLTFEGAPKNTSDIAEVWVVEVFYLYRPITPLPGFIKDLLITQGYDGSVIGSKAVF
jgi:hypothetical protein